MRSQPRAHLELSIRSSNGDGHVVTYDLSSHHRQCLALSRVHLARHDGRSWLILRQAQFTETASRSGSEVPDVVGDLHERDSEDVERTRGFDDGIMGRKCLEFVRGSLKWQASNLGNLSGDLDVKALARVQSLNRRSRIS